MEAKTLWLAVVCLSFLSGMASMIYGLIRCLETDFRARIIIRWFVLSLFFFILAKAAQDALIRLEEVRPKLGAVQQKEAARLLQSADIRPYDCIVLQYCKRDEAEAVVLTEPALIPGTGMSRVIAQRKSDGKLFAIPISAALTIVSGQKIDIVEVTYLVSGDETRMFVIGIARK